MSQRLRKPIRQSVTELNLALNDFLTRGKGFHGRTRLHSARAIALIRTEAQVNSCPSANCPRPQTTSCQKGAPNWGRLGEGQGSVSTASTMSIFQDLPRIIQVLWILRSSTLMEMLIKHENPVSRLFLVIHFFSPLDNVIKIKYVK